MSESVALLVRTLEGHTGDLTRADAAARSGVALHEVGPALHRLVDEYRGHLAATESGELLYRFPHGFTKPWERREAWQRALDKVGGWLKGGLRFAARVWVTVALVGYALLFLALLIAGAVALSRGNDDDGPGRAVAGIVRVVFEMIFQALYWSLHPFSPVRIGGQIGRRPRRAKADGKPFYETVNGFFFGPVQEEVDEGAQQTALLAAIRAGKGRIGLGDVMRITGLPRDEADPLMARLMVDYEGDVEVSEDGGIYFLFPELRRTAQSDGVQTQSVKTQAPPAIWEREEQVPPFTGNSTGANVGIGLLTAFNLAGAVVGVSVGAPWWLAELPLVGAGLLIAWPAVRAFGWFRRKAAAVVENGRRRLLRAILTAPADGLPDADAQAAFAPAPGAPTDTLLSFGGSLDLTEDGATIWRFPDLTLERQALQAARKDADDAEKEVGDVVFSSDS